MRALAIIPARKGSQRLPGKNRRVLGGQTLLARAAAACRDASAVGAVLLSSDDEVLLEEGEALGLDCLERPVEISGPESPAIEYVRHALRMRPEHGSATDAVAIVQLTSPFTQGQDIDACLRLLEASGGDSAVSVMRVDHAFHPHKFKRFGAESLLEDAWVAEGEARAAHELPPLFVRNGSVYAMRYETIEGGSLLGSRSYGYEMPRARSLDINDALDWALAETMLRDPSLLSDLDSV